MTRFGPKNAYMRYHSGTEYINTRDFGDFFPNAPKKNVKNVRACLLRKNENKPDFLPGLFFFNSDAEPRQMFSNVIILYNAAYAA